MKNPTILIADGDENLRRNLRRKLSSCGFDLIEASGIEDILKSLQIHKPDLIITGSSQKSICEGVTGGFQPISSPPCQEHTYCST